MTVGVRFSQFLEKIRLTADQANDGAAKAARVRSSLNTHYYGVTSETANSFYVGSWGKSTEMRPPRDIDIYFILPATVWERYRGRTGNVQSQLLQEVKGVLEKSYPRTDVRGDGPVIQIPLASYAIELAPVFKLTSGQYYIAITSGGGSWKNSDPQAEFTSVRNSNTASNGNTRDLIRMMKRWQSYCSVPIKSFWIELLAMEFLNQWSHRGKGTTYYDWMVRDFLTYLVGRKNTYVYAPGTADMMFIGDAWHSRAESALARAQKACGFESDSKPVSAVEEWRKIFGDEYPSD